ncbi:MAG: DUF401 family protein [Deltaproteobacteria bacterium]|nr:DUF401 family protein [Deltaproteobacteria bacterium]
MLSVFGLVLILNRCRLPLSLALFIGSLILGLWMDMGIARWAWSLARSMSDPQTVGLICIVVLILVMSRIMKETGHMDRLVERFALLSGDPRTVGSVMTALIGLLPMPGGALFSAPMVEISLAKLRVSPEQKTLLNYWFRHIWEYWWPLYPGVVLAVALLEVDTWRYMAVAVPMTGISVLAGAFFILRPMGLPAGKNPARDLTWSGVRAFLWEIMPILVVAVIILCIALATTLLDLAGYPVRIRGGLSILPGLLAGTLWICLVNRVSARQWKRALLDRGLLPMGILLLAIMAFKGTMVDSQAVVQIREELMAYRIPLVLIVMAMPFLSGMVTGVAMGFVGTSFPLIIPMFPNSYLFEYLSFAALAYTFGYMGMMLSPVHLCFLVTKDYYRASFLKSYLLLIKPVLSVMAGVSALFFLTRVL